VSSFLNKTHFPKWINADVGYGAERMAGAVINPETVDGKPIPSFLRQRKWFFGITGAFTSNNNIPYPSWINVFKVPSPVLELKSADSKIRFIPFYF
jgi:hypothetical protein